MLPFYPQRVLGCALSFTEQDGEHHPVYDFLATDTQTINKILDLAQEDGLAVLCKNLLTCYEEI
ncbi:hypothetical protein THERU_05075 [Thermocrinis ruber]|uniref:Uncharacterized protein n=1 Tax=Thermocrinis ruber TaxID=75906 RepID=W0DES6_9AQUI|nr:hypothetical protein THERU_05075 [Thermocrinis ruber]